MAWFDMFKRKSRAVGNQAVMQNIAQSAASSVRNRVLQQPDSRLSKDETSLVGLLGRMTDRFSGFPNDSAYRIRRVLRYLAQYDEDVSGALRDLIVLANAGHTIEFIGGSRAQKMALLEFETWSKTINKTGGGLNGLANNQIRELYLTGASSVEWYPDLRRRGVQDCAIVQGENVRFARDPQSGVMMPWQTYTALGDVALSPETYLYAPLQTDGASTYGVPLALSAISALERKTQLLQAEQRVINLMSRAALVKASIEQPTPESLGCRDIQDPNYAAATALYYNTVADLIMAATENGLYVAPQGVDIQLTNISKAGEGAHDIVQGNDRRVWTGLRTLGFMRGHMEHTTEALAKVVYPILEAEAQNIALVVAQQLEFGINLHLRLRGIPAVARVHFEQAPSAFAVDHATAAKLKAEKTEILKRVFGVGWKSHAEREWGVSVEDYLVDSNGWSVDSTGQLAAPPEPPPNQARAILGFDRSSGRYQIKEAM